MLNVYLDLLHSVSFEMTDLWILLLPQRFHGFFQFQRLSYVLFYVGQNHDFFHLFFVLMSESDIDHINQES